MSSLVRLVYVDRGHGEEALQPVDVVFLDGAEYGRQHKVALLVTMKGVHNGGVN